MGSYKQAVEPSTIMQAPDITKTRNGARTKYGLSLNYEQELNEFIGLFGQVSWNDGFNETWAFTEINQSVSLGFSADGSAMTMYWELHLWPMVFQPSFKII